MHCLATTSGSTPIISAIRTAAPTISRRGGTRWTGRPSKSATPRQRPERWASDCDSIECKRRRGSRPLCPLDFSRVDFMAFGSGRSVANGLSPLPLAARLRGRVRVGLGWGLSGATREQCRVAQVPPPRPSPASGRAVRGKLRIFEPQLIDREFGFGLARIDWRRLVDFCDRTSHEQSLADEFCKAQIENFQGIQTLREAQEQIGDHRGDDLQADSVAVVADELTKIEMLLDPAEQQFNLPAPLVEGRNLDCGAFEIVGDEGDGPALITFDLDASQRDRQLGIALAGEHDIIIGDDSEAVAYGLAQAGVHLDACDEESLGSVDLLPPAKMIVALVEDVGRAGFEFRLTADLDV